MFKYLTFVFGFVVVGLFVGVLSASANYSVLEQEYNLKSGQYLQFTIGTNTYIVVPNDASVESFFYVFDTENYVYMNGGIMNVYSKRSDGLYEKTTTVWNNGSHYGSYNNWIDFNGTYNIYTDDNKTSVFYSAPNPYVMKTVKSVEEIPAVMGAQMVGGGILSTGLMVLAILLGVFLVPRLIYSFLR